MIRSLANTALFGLALMLASPANAESDVSINHSAWQACLRDAFALQADLSGSALAADSALRECRERESAYLAALSASPLLNGEDVSRVRPALLARARLRLLGSGRSHQL